MIEIRDEIALFGIILSYTTIIKSDVDRPRILENKAAIAIQKKLTESINPKGLMNGSITLSFFVLNFTVSPYC